MNRLLGLSVCLLAAASSFAAVGDLEPAADSEIVPLRPQPLRAYSRNFKPAGGASSTVWPRASIAQLESAAGRVLVAIDARSKSATEPEVIRIDLTGKGVFNDEQVLPLKNTNSNGTFYSKIGPAVLQVAKAGKRVPVRVEGYYYRGRGTNVQVRLSLTTAVRGECAFGEKVYTVTVLDGDNNQAVADPIRVMRGRAGLQITGGDTVAVRIGEGEAAKVHKAFVAQPILVDDVWYRVMVAADGSKISAKALKIQTAHIKVPHERWTGLLTSGATVIAAADTTDPIAVPAGRYQVVGYSEIGSVDKDGDPVARMSCSPSAVNGIGRVQNAAAGKTTELRVGSPLQVRVQARARGRVVTMDFKMADAAGLGVDGVVNGEGKRPTPSVEVFDSQGNKVHAGAFEYG